MTLAKLQIYITELLTSSTALLNREAMQVLNNPPITTNCAFQIVGLQLVAIAN
jgi:hypothetical protein